MNKTELVNFVVLEANLSQTAAQRVVNVLFQTITGVLSEKGKVNLADFGSFSVQKRAARSGRHPQSGETIIIQAKNAPTFKPSKTFKEIVQQRKQ